MDDSISWVATVATIIAALMTASNLGSRITGYGFVVFTVGSLAWLAIGLMTGQPALVWTNAVLTVPQPVRHLALARAPGADRGRGDGGRARRASRLRARRCFRCRCCSGRRSRTATGSVLGTCVDAMAGCSSGRLRYVVVSRRRGCRRRGDASPAAVEQRAVPRPTGSCTAVDRVRHARGDCEGPMAGALIVTAELAPPDFAWLDDLRRRHYPAERNQRARASHHVPRDCRRRPRPSCARSFATMSDEPPPHARIAGVMDLGGGVAFRIVSDELDAIRDEIAERLHGLLTARTRRLAAARHHPEQGRRRRSQGRSCNRLASGFQAGRSRISGLGLHRYLGGPWETLRTFPFRG